MVARRRALLVPAPSSSGGGEQPGGDPVTPPGSEVGSAIDVSAGATVIAASGEGGEEVFNLPALLAAPSVETIIFNTMDSYYGCNC